MKSWRPNNRYKTMGPFTMKILGRDPYDFVPTRIFDNLAIIGNESYACYILETSEGLILMDCMEEWHASYIESCIIKLGYNPEELKYILITHEHADHYGNAGYFQEKYGARIYMSEIAERNARDPERLDGRFMTHIMPFHADGYLVDRGEFVCGDTVVKTYHTPGHSEGCMSFIFPVYDEGRAHKASLWGGTGCPRQLELARQQLKSLDSFCVETAKEGVDVTVSNHPFQDNTMERLELLHKLVDGVPNPFVMGEGYRRFELMLREEITEQIYKLENGIYDDTLDKIVAQAAAIDEAKSKES